MKVIVAGLSKTGTKSMVVALNELGYNVYDYMDHFWYHGQEWEKIFTKGASNEDFQRMYKDVDAIVDLPVYLFWEEIHNAFPDSRIILTTRDEEKWMQSVVIQLAQLKNNFTYKLMQILSPTGWKYYQHFRNTTIIAFKQAMNSPFDFSFMDNKMAMRTWHRQHDSYCRQNAPKDKLLVFSVKEGWEPLCKFLGKDVPDKPFPHENVGGVQMNKFMEIHPANIRMQREMFVSIGIMVGIGVFSVVKLYKGGHFMEIYNSMSCLKDFIPGIA